MTNTGLFIGQEQGGNYNTRRRLAQESLELRQQWSSMPFSSEQRGGFGNHLCRQHLCNELQLNRPPSSTTLTWNTLYLVFFMCWARGALVTEYGIDRDVPGLLRHGHLRATQSNAVPLKWYT